MEQKELTKNNLSWSFSGIWNESLARREEMELKPRNHIWATELGGAFIDRWYKMKGIKPSNPFDKRSLRKFEAGRVFEWIVEMVLTRAGLLRSTQDYVEYQFPGLLRVTGKLDHLAGGTPDWKKIKVQVFSDNVPDFIARATTAVIDYFSKKYPDGIKPLILEIKSVGSQMFHRYNVFKLADPKHALQLYHYLKGKEMPEGHIVYISKDDLCLTEVGIFLDNSNYSKLYEADITQMTEYSKSETPPSLEKPICFDEIAGRFYSNWKIGYSQYLTKIYGFKTQTDFDNKYKSLTERWNRVLGRATTGKTMTADNKDAILDIKRDFPEFDRLVNIAKERQKIKDEYENLA